MKIFGKQKNYFSFNKEFVASQISSFFKSFQINVLCILQKEKIIENSIEIIYKFILLVPAGRQLTF